jgi:hypothetical protein
VYSRSSGTWMTPLAKRVIQQIIAIAHNAHTALRSRGAYDDTFPFETPAKLFLRMLNSVMTDRSGSKTRIAYFIGNQLFRCYFKAHISLLLVLTVDGESSDV